MLPTMMSTIFLRNTTKMESSVPAWSMMSKNMPASFTPRSSFPRTRWPELEMGRNSARPCNRPKMMDSSMTGKIE